MKYFSNPVLVLIFAISFSACNSNQVNKNAKKVNKIIIKNSWVRTANKGATSAAYLTIINGTQQTDTLQGVTSKIAGMVGIHKTYHSDDGMTGMKEAGTIAIQPDSSFVLEPGGYHIMLMNLKKTLTKGDSVQIILDFAISGEKTIRAPVKVP